MSAQVVIKANPLVESLKEAGRVVVLSIIPILLASINTNTGEMAINWKVLLAVALFTLLRWLDSFLHERSKLEPTGIRNEGLLGTKGLVGF